MIIFPGKPDPFQLFFQFLPLYYFDNVEKWTQKKLRDKKVSGFESVILN